VVQSDAAGCPTIVEYSEGVEKPPKPGATAAWLLVGAGALKV
jgi:hypothetical protein